ncbi:MAG: efflux RND transporter periplasmic adaptor subunit [Chloroflexota bacterium]
MKSVVSQTSVPIPARRSRPRFANPFLLLLLAAVVAGGYFAYDRFFKPQPVVAPTVQKVAVSRGSIVSTVSATGSVVPAQTADLAFGTSGRLLELKAAVGQTVKKGDVLARLDTTDLQLEVLKAEAQLATAQSSLANLEAGSSAGEIAQARAQVQSTQASLDKLKAGATATELQSAEASVASARANLQKAETTLAELQAGPTETELTSAKIALEKARISVHNAQSAYDKIAWRNDAAATQEAMTLWQATTDYRAAEIAHAKAIAGPTASELSIAEQSVVSARAQLAVAEASMATLQKGAAADALATSEAAVIQARSQLETKLNPTTPAALQAARATVEQARVGVQSAKSNLEKAVIAAPFEGVVATVAGTVGQTVTGTVVSLLDLSAPLLQFSLPEADVAKVAVGQQAAVTFDSLGGQQLSGKVMTISPKATVSSGVATYAATISIENTPPRAQAAGPAGQGMAGLAPQGGRQAGATGVQQSGAAGVQQPAAQTVDLSKLRVGMTGSVSVEYLRKDNVLVVPNRAVAAQGRNRVVEVVVGDTTEKRTVTVGATDDTRTEIVSGLAEGDQVVISAASTTTSTTTGNRNPQAGGFPGGGLVPGAPVIMQPGR